MRNVALLLAYDGTDFIGSQWQNQGRSVQGAREEAWEGLTQERRRFTRAGRTDSGVHAHGQRPVHRGLDAEEPARCGGVLKAIGEGPLASSRPSA